MKKILFLSSLLATSISFAEINEAAMIREVGEQVGPLSFMATGLGGMLVFLAAVLSYIAVAYGIYLLAKKYEPKVHPAWSWIPIVQIYPLVKVSGQPLWWILVIFLGSLVPGIGGLITLVACIFIYHKISERTGRGAGTTALLFFFSVIMLPWLGLEVNKKSTTPAWILGVAALLIGFVGFSVAGAGAMAGLLGLKRNHRFMDRAREEVMEEIRENPTIREQMKEIQDQLNQANVSGSAKGDVAAE